MTRYKITIEYDGTNTVGWQKQQKPNSIQENIEEAIYKFSGLKVNVFGSGRTDAGVHAFEQVAHFDLEKFYEPHIITNALNYYLKLKSNIVILSSEIVDKNFHARFDAKSRIYKYLILNRSSASAIYKNRAWHVRPNIDIKKIQEASTYLLGKHDFSSFRASSCQAKSPVRTIDEIKIIKSDDLIEIYIKAQSFLQHMVRNIIGTLIYIAKNEKMKPSDIKIILEERNRARAFETAPAHGLYFYKVIF